MALVGVMDPTVTLIGAFAPPIDPNVALIGALAPIFVFIGEPAGWL